MDNIIRVTKAQKFEVIKSLLPQDATHTFPGNEKKDPYVFNHDEMIKFLTGEIALLKKKNTTGADGKKKLTKDQRDNEEYKGVILTYLTAHPAEVITATDTMEKLLRPAYPAVLWTNQRAAALLNALSDKYDKEGNLVSEGPLNRVPGKGKTKTTFQIKPEYVIEEEDNEDVSEDESAE